MNGNDFTEGAVAGALAGIRVVELAHIMAGPVWGRMLASCDVVIENFRNGVMEGFGLGYESLRAANPGLVYCQITGFGRTGPLADHRGFDLIAADGWITVGGWNQVNWLRLLDALELGELAGDPRFATNDVRMREALRHPQTAAREMVVTVEQGGEPVETLGMPVKLSETPAPVERGAPRLGEHTEEVLGEYGFDEAEIVQLLRSGAVGRFNA